MQAGGAQVQVRAVSKSLSHMNKMLPLRVSLSRLRKRAYRTRTKEGMRAESLAGIVRAKK